MSVEVVKRITEDVKEFDKKEDFIKFYELNKNELKDVSTCMLNKKFKIKGYHIGRKQKQIQLIPLDLYRPSAYKVNNEDNQINLKIDVLNNKVNNLNNKVDTLNKIIVDLLKQLKDTLNAQYQIN